MGDADASPFGLDSRHFVRGEPIARTRKTCVGPVGGPWSAALAFVALSCAAPPPSQPREATAGSMAAPPTPATGFTAAAPSPVGKTARIPEATFRMGSEIGEPDEMPVHTARVSAFDMDLTEVTVAEYAECVRSGACVPAASIVLWPGVTSDDQELSKDMCNEDRPDRQDHAINCVDWKMADAYCRWAGERLPTEEEWEYAACGGDCNLAMKSQVGHSVVRGAARWPYTSRVARSGPGPFGLYDMAGNVWEWTASPYCPYDRPQCGDPRRVVRGGSWSVVDYLFVRLTDRAPNDPSTRNTNVGFRCARSPSVP
jgi:formylglycine-generating enzyme required for sulfatase activity